MKKNILGIMAMLFMTIICCVQVSCNSSDDDDENREGKGGTSVDVTKLVGYTYYQSKDDFEHPTNYEVTFKSTVFASVHSYGKDLSDEGWERWDNGTVECIYKVAGNQLTIYYDNGKGLKKEFIMTFKNGEPVDWSRGDKNIYDEWSEEEREKHSYLFEAVDPQPGDPSIFGFYLRKRFEIGAELASAEAAGDYYGLERSLKYENNNMSSSFGLYISDEHTIHYVVGGATSKGVGTNEKVFQTKTYNFREGRWTVYFYYRTDYFPYTHKYVICGDKMLSSDGEVITIRGESLYCDEEWNGDYFEYVKQ